MGATAFIPVDLQRSRLGTRSRVADRIAGATVLAHTLRRVARVPSVDRIVLVHPANQDPLALIDGADIGVPVATHPDPRGLRDRHTDRLRVARLWAPAAWRGGLGGATAFDELLPAGPLVEAMEAHGARSCLLVGGDWCLVDPALCEAVLAQHLAAPDGMKLTFTQAPPGLCGVATSAKVLGDLAQHGATFGNILGYNPRAPIADPIGKEANLPIPPEVRDAGRRFVCDTERAARMIERVLAGDADADAVKCAAADPCSESAAGVPPWVTLELTPRRGVNGPITPQHYATFARPDLGVDLARRIAEQVAEVEGACLLLGGPAGGDALLHPQWFEIAEGARAAGVASVGVETDLLCDEDDLRRLLDGPIDLVTIRLNADTAATYERVMGTDRFKRVISNMEWLINTRNRRGAGGAGRVGLPWLLPRMIKTRDTLPEMETFFDRWTLYAGHAVIEPAQTGGGVMPDLSPVPMAPPRRGACRQLGRRLTILSDGTVLQCDQDWRGEAPAGDAKIEPLTEACARIEALREQQAAGRFDASPCGRCNEWHRP